MTALAYRRTAPSDQPIKRRKIKLQRVRMGSLSWLALLLLASIVLLFDALVIGRYVGLIRLPGEMSDADMARAGAAAYVEMQANAYSRERGRGAGSAWQVFDSAGKRLSGCRSVEDVGRELSALSSEIERAVTDDRVQAARNRVTEIVLADIGPRIKPTDSAYVLITPQGTEARVQDRLSVLSKSCVEKIQRDSVIVNCPQAIEVYIEGSQISFDTGDPEARIHALEREISSLTVSLAKIRADSGYAEIEGTGITALAYDGPSAYAWVDIVHQKDVLDIIDALFGAGAYGVQVGSERVIATTSVRCIGPVILVNQVPVPVNPVRIYAVGDPARLARSLSSIQASFARDTKKLEVTREKQVRLSAYHKGGAAW